VRVLITGAGGRLAGALVPAFDGHEVVAATRDDLDVTDEPAVVSAVTDLAPGLVINTAAWTDVDGCEGDADRAHRVNAIGAWWVARAAALVDAVVVQLSTDHVFGAGGARPADPEGWSEFDPPAPVNAYGRSKAAAEQLVLRATPRHHVVRTSWLLADDGTDFVTAVTARAREHGRVEVVDDQIGAPTAAADLALAIRELAVSGRYGIWHRTNAGACSRYELARTAIELAGIDADVVPISSAGAPRPAPRPAWSTLANRHALQAGLQPLRPWQDALRDRVRSASQ
jgi:dTDP-4-dehydrorhamnose reductase